MSTTWLLIADHRQANLFGVDSERETVSPIESFRNVTGRGDARIDVQVSTSGTATLLGDPHASVHDALTEFAAALAEILEEGFGQSSYDQLIILAPARFAGALYRAFGDELKACVRVNDGEAVRALQLSVGGFAEPATMQ